MGEAEAKKVKRNPDGSVDGIEYLEALDGPLTFGRMINSIRYCDYDEESLAAFAKRLGVTAQHLCDVEKGRRVVSPERAARWASALAHPPALFVQLALQGALDAAGIKLKVRVEVPEFKGRMRMRKAEPTKPTVGAEAAPFKGRMRRRRGKAAA